MTAMHIDAFKTDNGYEYQGTLYPDAEHMIHIGVFNFCYCANPETSLAYIRQGLELIAETCPLELSPELWFQRLQHKQIQHSGSLEAALFFLYWADREGLIEHSSNIQVSWLTERGEAVLHDLRLLDLEDAGEERSCQQL